MTPSFSPKSFSCLRASLSADFAQLLEDKDLRLRTSMCSTRASSSPDFHEHLAAIVYDHHLMVYDEDRESDDDLLAYTG